MDSDASKPWPARLWPPPQKDAVALGFGLAFLIFGAAGLARIAGAAIEAAWLPPLVLVCLGVAGLLRSLQQQRAR